MNNLTFIKPKKQLGKIKLTLQKSGKFGFSNEASKILNLTKNRFIKFGVDNYKNIFLKVQQEHDEECFRISKAGAYFYLNYSELLEIFNVKKTDSITFDLIKDKGNYFKMKIRNYGKDI